MLIEFRVENHRSIRTEQVITFEAGRVGAADDPVPRQVGDLRLLPVLAVYGANASGKSNLLQALLWLQSAVVRSSANWTPDGGVPVSPFAWGDGPEAPSMFEVAFLLDGVRHEYGVVATPERFLEEWLFTYPHGRKRTLFVREDTEFKFGEHLEGENSVVRAATRPNALFLSTAAQLQHVQLRTVNDWFRTFASGAGIKVGARDFAGNMVKFARRAESGQEPSFSKAWETVNRLLRVADLGVQELRIEEVSAAVEPWIKPRIEVQLRHGDTIGEGWLPLSEESTGTQRMLELAVSTAMALTRGLILVVDELESSLHPLLARKLVGLFNDPATNPLNAQLLFSTHDTTLIGSTIGEPVLRRDQIWLTEKDPTGQSCLYPLTDYKPRGAENLERGYLQGRYGAIPFLGDLLPRTV